jgi:uncharacterized protein YaiI (UPF0178 family)
MKLIIDADACPRSVLKICLEVGRSYAIPVWTVASFNHEIVSDNHIVVGNNSQEADLKIINLTLAGDIIVTQDWGLAAMILGRNAYCLSPGGREYREDKIQFLLEEREAKARLRRAGGRTKGPKKRTPDDDRNFLGTLERIIGKALNNI